METCRTCAKIDFDSCNDWLDLFHPTRWQHEIEQIHYELVQWKLRISINDGLPQKICFDCFTKFCNIATFRSACQDAQLKLCNIFERTEAYTFENETEIVLLENNDPDGITKKITARENGENASIDIFVGLQSATELPTYDEIIEVDDCLTNEGGDAQELVLTFACKYCYNSKQIYGTQEELFKHITANHDAKLPFNCPECRTCFQDAASRTVHMKDQHVEKHFLCTVCGKKYSDRSNLRHHVEKYHSETDFECNMCEKRFYTRKSLNYHMKWHNPECQLKCSHCDRLFLSKRHLKCHEATHTGERSSEVCGLCGKTFIHLKTLRWHIYRQHGGEKPYKCGNCTEVFASYAEKRLHKLDKHTVNLTPIERSECMICRKQYSSEQELKQHMYLEHIQRKHGVPLIENNKRVLQKKREKQYSGVFQCTQCGQRFNMKSALERHAAVHSVEGRPHPCPQCSKRFKRAQDMKWHMKTHSNEKPNICDICGKGFALKYVLTQHKRSHEVLEKNFKCTTCGRAYLFEKSLRLHERVHTGETYYKCDLCEENFVTHIKLKCHMKKMHAEKNERVFAFGEDDKHCNELNRRTKSEKKWK